MQESPGVASNTSPMTHDEQWQAAFAKGAPTHHARALVRKAIYAGEMSVSAALDLECVASMRVEQLLRYQYRWGIQRASRLLNTADVSMYLLIRELTPRQVEALREALDGEREG
jgi:hypothetical protein